MNHRLSVLLPAVVFVILSVGLIRAQAGDLPVPANYEQNLIQRGYSQRYLPVQSDTLVPSSADQDRGWLLYQRDRNYEVLPNSKPAPHETPEVIRIVAAPGEIESEPFSAYALRDLGSLEAETRAVNPDENSSWLSGSLVVEDVLFHPVRYRTRSNSGQNSYLRYPIFIRPPSSHPVPAGESRLYWVTVDVPEDMPEGIYRAAIRVTDDLRSSVELPLEVEVLPFKLTEEGLPFFGAFLSSREFAGGEWAFMKRYGLDALQWFWNSHSIKISNVNGRVNMDFTEYDNFVRGMQEGGMKGPLVLSLGNSWIGHYEKELAGVFDLPMLNITFGSRNATIADMTDPRWEEPYIEGLRLIFEHAEEAGWPPLALLIMDEPTKYLLEYYPLRFHLIKKYFPEIPIYGVFFQPDKDPIPLVHTCDIMVANRDLDRIKTLSGQYGKGFWTYNNACADESFGKVRLLIGQIPSYYESAGMWFWCWNYYISNPWDDFDGWEQSDADWVAVYPSVDGVEPVRTLAVEAVREGIDDVRYLKTLENLDPGRWTALRSEIRSRQQSIFEGIIQDNRIYSDEDFFITTRNDDVERLRELVIEEILKSLNE